MSLNITTQGTAEKALVSIVGEVDVSNAPELRSALDAALEAGAKSVDIDFSEVPYIDSTGIGVLVGAAHRAADQGATVSVRSPQRNVRRVLDLLGVAGELNVSE